MLLADYFIFNDYHSNELIGVRIRLVMLEKYIKAYQERTKRSRMMFEKAKMLFAGGVNHNIRYFHPYPFYTIKAKGKYIYDIDDNRYTDYWQGHWSLILGHANDHVISKVKEQVEQGSIYGTVNIASIELAEKIRNHVPRAELIRFANTGAEATMYAVRLARAYTRKRYVAKIEGGWHGFNTDLLKGVNYPFTTEGLGLIEEEMRYIINIPYNDQEAISTLDQYKDDLACIIVEPFLGGAGAIPADKDYLKALEEYAKSNDILLIFDEIVTCFRFRLGSMHDMLDIDPDLITLGKIVGGGLPIGVVAGKEEIMRLASPELDNKDRCNIGGGTFSANPLSMRAGLATIEYLEANENVYDKINRLGDIARREIDKVMYEFNIKTHTTGYGSLFLTHFLANSIDEVRNARDAALCNINLQKAYHLALMIFDIFFLPHKLGAISIMHEEQDIKELINASVKIAEDIANDQSSL